MDQHEPAGALERERHKRELAAIEAGLASADAGRTISLEAVVAWLERLDTEPDAPVPQPD